MGAAIVAGLLSGDKVHGWRLMLGLGGVPSAIQLVGLYFLPESPRWLLSRGREQEARQVLRRLRADSHDVDDAVEAEVAEVIAALEAEGIQPRRRPPPSLLPASSTRTAMGSVPPPTGLNGAGAGYEIAGGGEGGSEGSGPVSWSELWTVRRQLRLGVGLLMLQQLVGINTVMYYSVTILMEAHVASGSAVIWLAVPVATSQLVGCLIGGSLIDCVGRRPLVLTSLLGVALALALEGYAFVLSDEHCPVASPPQPPDAPPSPFTPPLPPWAPPPPPPSKLCELKSALTLGGLVLYLLAFGIGMSPIPWALNAELYPMRVRATCVALGTTANWVTNFIVAATFLSLQTAVGSPAAFWLYGSVALLGAVWLYITMPETAGRSLEQIERLFPGYGTFPADAAAPSVQRT